MSMVFLAKEKSIFNGVLCRDIKNLRGSWDGGFKEED